jgi:class 3 adenylate cyclase/sensor domain CHASE-containing protein
MRKPEPVPSATGAAKPAARRAPRCARVSAWRGWRELRAAPCRFLGLAAFLFAVLGGGGLGVLMSYATHEADEGHAMEQARARELVSSVAASFGAQLRGALNPSLAVATFIESGPPPTHEAVQRWFMRAAPALVMTSPAIDSVQIAPYGHVAAIYPLVSARRNATGILLGGDPGGGHDLFNASSILANRRQAAIQALTTRQLHVEGPKNLLSPLTTCLASASNICKYGQFALLSRIPLFASTTAAADPWSLGYRWAAAPGGPPLGPFTNVTGCDVVRSAATGASLCDTDATGDGRRFWGFFTIIVMWNQLLELAGIERLGAEYKWSIARSDETSDGTGAFPLVVVSSSDGSLPTSAYAAGAVSNVVRAYSSAWVITIEPRTGSLTPVLQDGAIAGVVVLAVLITALIVFIALQQQLNDNLLYSMLPRRIVSMLRAGEEHIAEHFEHVTLLFTDIVRFTDLVGTITPRETMAMLNDLFMDFDEIAQRHGVTKLETVGDAFVAVAGISGERDPCAQALQIARCALEMVECAGRHELPNSGNMLIRVGLHCGPAVGGVVGRTLPHYSIFGDTINTTARMESNSLPGRIHVSDKFAAAFAAAEAVDKAAAAAAAAAGAPLPPPLPFYLQPRGAITVKGKGVMETHFLLRRGDVISPDEMLGPSSPPRTFDSGTSKNSSLKNAIVGPVTVTGDDWYGML